MTINRIKFWRKERKLTQDELAQMAGMSKPQLVKLERGERRLHERWVMSLAEALHIRVSDLFDAVPSANRQSDAGDYNYAARVAALILKLAQEVGVVLSPSDFEALIISTCEGIDAQAFDEEQLTQQVRAILRFKQQQER